MRKASILVVAACVLVLSQGSGARKVQQVLPAGIPELSPLDLLGMASEFSALLNSAPTSNDSSMEAPAPPAIVSPLAVVPDSTWASALTRATANVPGLQDLPKAVTQLASSFTSMAGSLTKAPASLTANLQPSVRSTIEKYVQNLKTRMVNFDPANEVQNILADMNIVFNNGLAAIETLAPASLNLNSINLDTLRSVQPVREMINMIDQVLPWLERAGEGNLQATAALAPFRATLVSMKGQLTNAYKVLSDYRGQMEDTWTSFSSLLKVVNPNLTSMSWEDMMNMVSNATALLDKVMPSLGSVPTAEGILGSLTATDFQDLAAAAAASRAAFP